MEYNESLASVVSSPEEAIKVIADTMLKLRPKGEVEYRPYRKNDVYYDKHEDLRIINLKKLYPEAKPGNVVYISTVLEACVETDAKINYIGNAKVVFENEVIFDTLTDISPDGKCRCPIHLKKGENPVTFMVRCDNENTFEFRFMPSVRKYWVWAKCYLLSARATSPVEEFKNEDGVGISKLYECEMPFDGKFVYPLPPVTSNTVDFKSIYSAGKGNFAYALTYGTNDGELTVRTDCTYKIFVNGNEVSGNKISFSKGDSILIKVKRGKSWSFEFDEKAGIGIPFLKSSRKGGDKWLILGTFGNGICIDEKFGPEYEIQFKKPYIDADCRKAFWKLADKDDYVRPYLSTRFFGQWHYTFMVGSFGLLNAARVLGKNAYKEYYMEHMQTMVDYFEYMRYELETFGSPSFLDISSTLRDLDSIGSIGRNLCEYYFITGNYDVLHCINTLAKAAKENIPRFEDGTYHRPTDMWADDIFMSCPFLIRMGKITGDCYYYEEVIRQLLGFKKRLWMKDENIFSHIYFLDTQKPNNIPWGRGNGWIFVSLSDALMNIPKTTPGYDDILELFQTFAGGIASLQDSDGLWHQVLNRHDSYQETSCSAMYMLGMCRGIQNGWLDESYRERIVKAYRGIISKKINKSGTVFDVCMGSGNSTDVNYYMNLGAIDNDDHGTGVILTAICEMINTL